MVTGDARGLGADELETFNQTAGPQRDGAPGSQTGDMREGFFPRESQDWVITQAAPGFGGCLCQSCSVCLSVCKQLCLHRPCVCP